MNKIAYAYLYTRHGARNYLDEGVLDLESLQIDVASLPVEPNELTPQGMRQKYLKGKYNR